MSYRIRHMLLRHSEGVLALWKRTAGIGFDKTCDTRTGLARYLKRNPGLSFVAVIDGTVVGAVLSGHDGRRGYLHHLAVSRRFRNLGIGNDLVAHCLNGLRKARIPKCDIFLYKSNLAGRAYWTHTGWRLRHDLSILQKRTGWPASQKRRQRRTKRNPPAAFTP